MPKMLPGGAVWPAGLVAAATSIDAVFPLAVAMLLTGHAPLILGAGVVAGLAAGSVVYLAAAGGGVMRAAASDPGLLLRHMKRRLFVLSALGRLDRPLFVAAVALAGATAPTLVHGLTPISYMLVLERSMGRGRYQPMGARSAPLLVLAAAGVSLVVLSQPAQPFGGGRWAVAAAMGLSLVSVAAASLTALHLRWGTDYARASGVGRRAEMAASLMGTVLAAVVAVPCLLIAGVVLGGFDGAGTAFMVGTVIGMLLRTPTVVLLRVANYATASVSVNALSYLSPVMSLGLLVWLGHAGGVDVRLAACGATAIVASNMVLARQRSSADRRC